MGRATVERAGRDSALPAGDKSRAQPVGRCRGRFSGWIALTHADVLCELGTVYATRRTGHTAGGNLPGVGNPGNQDPQLAVDGLGMDRPGWSCADALSRGDLCRV